VSKRSWNKKYTKKKTSSQIIDEKIALLDREMGKTKLGESILDNLEKQLILDEMDYDILIKKLSKLQEDKNSFNETKKSLKKVKQVVGK